MLKTSASAMAMINYILFTMQIEQLLQKMKAKLLTCHDFHAAAT